MSTLHSVSLKIILDIDFHFQEKKQQMIDVLLLFCVQLCLWNLLEIKKSKLVYFSQDLTTHKPFENKSINGHFIKIQQVAAWAG